LNIAPTNLDRRRFLKTSVAGAAGLIIGFYLPAPGEMLAESPSGAPPAALNAWIHIGTDDIVTIMIDKSEMGQGIMTGLAMLATEELECDWKNVRTEFAPNAKFISIQSSAFRALAPARALAGRGNQCAKLARLLGKCWS
jgi:CO/xanthine dehydrogenase Mo-binding subunit